MKSSMRPLALPNRMSRHQERCDFEQCGATIQRGEAKLVTRDTRNMPRRFCAATCFRAWADSNLTRFSCRPDAAN